MNKIMIRKCSTFAEEVHAGSFRRDGKSPRIDHSQRVSDSILLRTLRQRCVALLHDVIEDFPEKKSTPEIAKIMLDYGIPEEVVEKVVQLTHEPKDLYLDYIKAIKEGAYSDDDCLLVKVADILDNLTDDPSKKQIKKYRKALKLLL